MPQTGQNHYWGAEVGLTATAQRGDPGGARLRQFYAALIARDRRRLPFAGVERLDSLLLVEMEHKVELLAQTRCKVMARALSSIGRCFMRARSGIECVKSVRCLTQHEMRVADEIDQRLTEVGGLLARMSAQINMLITPPAEDDGQAGYRASPPPSSTGWAPPITTK